MTATRSDALRVAFGDFELDPRTHELWQAGRPVRLKPQPRRVLALLLDRAGEAVSREEIRRAVWGEGVHVDFDLGLNSCLAQLRRALGDGAEVPRFIETVPRFGYRFIAPVQRRLPAQTGSATDRARAARRRLPWTVGALALLVTAALAGMVALRPGAGGSGAASAASTTVIVVLPLRNATGAPALDLVAEAVTEETTAFLARLSPERLGVIARTSAAQYAQSGHGVAQIGRELNAGYAVEGSLTRNGDHVRVNVRLVRTADQVHVWAASHDGEEDRLLGLGRSVARDVARAVAERVLGGEAVVRARVGTEDETAYREYLRGREASFLGTDGAMAEAIVHFHAAVAADPSFAAGHAGLAGALVLRARSRPRHAKSTLEEARQEAAHAVALDA